MITVKFWDGTTKPAANREEAVQIIKTGLRAWMQKGDRIVWIKQLKDVHLPSFESLPSFALVINELDGEATDAWATVGGIE